MAGKIAVLYINLERCDTTINAIDFFILHAVKISVKTSGCDSLVWYLNDRWFDGDTIVMQLVDDMNNNADCDDKY